MDAKKTLKTILGELPYTAELHWLLRQKDRPRNEHFTLDRLKAALPADVQIAQSYAEKAPPGKKIVIFATLHYWIEQAAYVALTLAAAGHQVTLMTLPYAEWHQPMDKYTQRQRNVYTRNVMRPLKPLVEHVSMLDIRPERRLHPELEETVRTVSQFDVQYTLASENVEYSSSLFDLRLDRNRFAAGAALAWMQANRPDLLVVPNGMIIEMGVVYQVARFLDIPALTYEFNDQREQIWMAKDSEIMRQNTDDLWFSRGHQPLSDKEWQRIADLENARRGAKSFGKSERLWQFVSSEGAQAVREKLNLDDRPIVLLATNVLGDSLTLGRHVFSDTMSKWIRLTVKFFANRTDAQLVIRIHPGETLSTGDSMADVVREALPELPENIHLVDATDKINTYDLLEIASLGLVYTTTTGLEMSMTGLPVIVSGQTHYRERGFTLDPESWGDYFSTIEQVLENPSAFRLAEAQVKTAWNYAYRFFFEYPRPFPWRVLNFWEDLKTWPLASVLTEEGRARFANTFSALANAAPIWPETLEIV